MNNRTVTETSTQNARDLIPVWLDCDPGIDDALAILTLLHACPNLRLLGVSTVVGNADLPTTTRNAKRIVDAAGFSNIQILPGRSQPLLIETNLEEGVRIHGRDGMGDNSVLPELTSIPFARESAEASIVSMYRRITASLSPVTIIAVAPLTNIGALLLTLELKGNEAKMLKFREKIDKIIFLGGCIGQGNATPLAEFNAFGDPHAASCVFRCGIPLVMVGTHIDHIKSSQNLLDHARRLFSPFGAMIVELLESYQDAITRLTNRLGITPYLYDVAAVLYAHDPSRFRTQFWNVCVETQSELTMGCTVVDSQKLTKRKPNTHVVIDFDVGWGERVLMTALERASRVSPLSFRAGDARLTSTPPSTASSASVSPSSSLSSLNHMIMSSINSDEDVPSLPSNPPSAALTIRDNDNTGSSVEFDVDVDKMDIA